MRTVAVANDISALSTAAPGEVAKPGVAGDEPDWYWMQDEHFPFIEVGGSTPRTATPTSWSEGRAGKSRASAPCRTKGPTIYGQLERHEPLDFVFRATTRRASSKLSASGYRRREGNYHGHGLLRHHRARDWARRRGQRALLDAVRSPSAASWAVDANTLAFAVNVAANASSRSAISFDSRRYAGSAGRTEVLAPSARLGGGLLRALERHRRLRSSLSGLCRHPQGLPRPLRPQRPMLARPSNGPTNRAMMRFSNQRSPAAQGEGGALIKDDADRVRCRLFDDGFALAGPLPLLP